MTAPPPPPSSGRSAATTAAEALGVFVQALAGLEQATPDSTAFYDRMCEAVCQSVDVDRAVLFLYDEGRRRVRPVGTHRIDHHRFPPEGVGIEDAPLSRVALEEDRVVDALDGPGGDLRPDLASLPEGDLAYVPITAGGTWFGIMIVERGDGEPLAAPQRDALWIAGKVVAIASEARRATRHQDQARQLSQRLDLARRVHDQVIQRLFGIGLVLGGEGELPSDARERAREEVEAAQADLRDLLAGDPIRAAPPTKLRLEEEVARLRRAHATVELRHVVEDGVRLREDHEALAQGVLGEAVRNALKHGEPTVLEVAVALRDGAVAMTVDSDGVSQTHPPRRGRTGLGLRLAALEALRAGGLLEFGPRAPNGWRVRLILPHDGTDEGERA